MTPEEESRAKVAEAAMQRRAAVISGHRYQPKLVWSLAPMSENELRSLVTADGNSPLVYLNSMLLPRSALLYAGAPTWAQYAFLVLVEVKATFGAAPPA